jgi:hypothetical protein
VTAICSALFGSMVPGATIYSTRLCGQVIRAPSCMKDFGKNPRSAAAKQRVGRMAVGSPNVVDHRKCLSAQTITCAGSVTRSDVQAKVHASPATDVSVLHAA